MEELQLFYTFVPVPYIYWKDIAESAVKLGVDLKAYRPVLHDLDLKIKELGIPFIARQLREYYYPAYTHNLLLNEDFDFDYRDAEKDKVMERKKNHLTMLLEFHPDVLNALLRYNYRYQKYMD